MKCAVCKGKIETTFLKKMNGTIIKIKGKPFNVCSVCQREKGEAEIIKELS